MTISVYEFDNVLGGLDGLKKRRENIERLRRDYYAALARETGARSREDVLAEAKKLGIELFDTVPLATVAEANAVTAFATQLRQDAEIIRNAKDLTDLRNVDISELQRKLDQLRLTNEQAEKTINQSRMMESQLGARRGSLGPFTLQRIIEDLALLRLLSASAYERHARALIDSVQRALTGPSSADIADAQKEAIQQEVERAQEEYDAWMYLKRLHPEFVSKLESLDSKLERGDSITADQRAELRVWIQNLSNTSHLPAVLARLAAQVGQQTEDKKTRVSYDHLGAEINRWWRTWRSLDTLPAHSTGPTDQLAQLQSACEKLMSDPGYGNEPVLREVLLAWRRRLWQASEFSMALEGIELRLNDQNRTVDGGECLMLINRMHELATNALPEVYWLVANRWENAYNRLISIFETSTDGQQQKAQILVAVVTEQRSYLRKKRDEGEIIVPMVVLSAISIPNTNLPPGPDVPDWGGIS